MISLHHGNSVISTPLGSLSAARKFGMYKDVEPQGIRQAEVSGTEIQELRRKREMLLSMNPEQAQSVIAYHNGVDVIEALALAKRQGRIIVPHIVHDRILTQTKEDESGDVNYAVWTGTVVIYPENGKPFGERVVHCWTEEHKAISHSISLDIPARFRGKTDSALVIEHPDFDLKPEQLRENAYLLIADEGSIHLHERFPAVDGEYAFDERYVIPAGSSVAENRDTSRTLRRQDGPYIGFVLRSSFSVADLTRRVVISDPPSNAVSVALY